MLAKGVEQLCSHSPQVTRWALAVENFKDRKQEERKKGKIINGFNMEYDLKSYPTLHVDFRESDKGQLGNGLLAWLGQYNSKTLHSDTLICKYAEQDGTGENTVSHTEMNGAHLTVLNISTAPFSSYLSSRGPRQEEHGASASSRGCNDSSS